MDYWEIFLTLIFGLSMVVAWYLSERQKLRRKFAAQPLKLIKHCQNDQLSKIQGDLRLSTASITAPLSRRQCAMFRAVVEENIRSGNSSRWQEVFTDEHKTNFLIKQGENYAYIMTDEARCLLNKDANFSSGTFNDATDKLEAYLNAFGHKSTSFFGLNKSLRYKEGVLEENEQVSVCGIGKWYDIGQLCELDFLQCEGVTKVFVFRDTPKQPLYVSDDLKVLV